MPFQEKVYDGLHYMTATNIGTIHAFTTRFGGVSGGVHSSLNLGYKEGDSPENVRRNYAILGRALGFGPKELVFSHQVHKDDVRIAGPEDRRAPYEPIPYEADGLVTAELDLPLIIFTADCTPILLHDPVRGAIGAVHAGWRGERPGYRRERRAKNDAGVRLPSRGYPGGDRPVYIGLLF